MLDKSKPKMEYYWKICAESISFSVFYLKYHLENQMNVNIIIALVRYKITVQKLL